MKRYLLILIFVMATANKGALQLISNLVIIPVNMGKALALNID